MITRRRFGVLTAGVAASTFGQFAHAARNESTSKRGICFTTKPESDWLKRVTAINAAWMYSWGPRRPEPLPAAIDFTPMVWGDSTEERLTAKLTELKAAVKSGAVRHVLGFNEPDQKSQSNMSVKRAVELWPRLMELDVPLISPGCVHPDREWMHEFMEEVERKNLRVDAVAVHSYGGPNAEHFMRRLNKVYREFGRPLWITEFAVGDWEAKKAEQNRHSPAKIAAFMQELLPALKAVPYVQRYAWFSASQNSGPLGTSALFDTNGELTELGRLYANAS